VFAQFRALSATATGQAAGRAALSIAARLVSNRNLLAVALRRVAAAIADTRTKAATAKQRAMAATAFERVKTATAVERSPVAVGRSNTMSQTNPLSPDIDATVEFETVTFDYGLILAAGATITSATVTCSVVSGTDPAPSSRVVGSPSNTRPLQIGAASAAMSQLVGAMVAGVTYRLQCVATTSDGQSLSLWTHLTCQVPSWPWEIRPFPRDEWAKNLNDKERLLPANAQQDSRRGLRRLTHETARRHAYAIFNRPHVREAIEHLLCTRTGVTDTWLVDKLVAIIDTDLADVSEWDEYGDLGFKTSGELSALQKVAVSEIAQERGRDGIRTLKISFTTSCRRWRTSPSCSTYLSTVRKSAGRTAGLSR
jgi:hypothetical protein